ncbi:MAG: tripartite tricarboxylate transporter permease [Acidaminococcales bacterium]|jgi:putative tricarboxylic transport membrane protein|nr:tripartite tricarboxylate transporter permease [Acidaminococcales bacterium]
MELLQNVIQGFGQMANPGILAFCVAGALIGVVFGAIPGLTATTAIAMFTPMTFKMSLETSFAFLLGIYCGGYYAGSIPAILIRTPGAPGNAATCLDGYPMCEQGKAGKALSLSVVSSCIGGLFSSLMLFLFAPLVSSMALRFGAPEYFAVALMGMTCIISVSSKDLVKGVAGALIGVVISMIGMDSISGMPRFTFGSVRMMAGVSLIPALIGFFALTEVFGKTEEIGRNKKMNVIDLSFHRPVFMEYWAVKWNLFKACVIGTVIGAIPGTGPTIASWLAYNEAKRTSKNPEQFGKGSSEGIIACEASNNAVTGGALIPLLTLGIPGDSVTAILLGALMLQGLTPGPMMLMENFGILAFFLAVLFVSNIVMLIAGLFGSKFFPYILAVPSKILIPFVMVFCLVGTYASSGSFFDLKAVVAIGILGFALQKMKFTMPPLVLGFLLGPILENNFQRAMLASNNNPLVFVQSPLSVGILLLTAILTVVLYRRQSAR